MAGCCLSPFASRSAACLLLFRGFSRIVTEIHDALAGGFWACGTRRDVLVRTMTRRSARGRGTGARASGRGNDSPAWGDMPVPPLHQLTDDPDKRQQYAADPLLREGWATLVGVLGEGAALRFASESAIAWLRPDVAAAGAMGEVAARIDAAGFVAVGAVFVRLGRADVRALWWC